ncbi:choice-of-anchor A family protein [Catenovulum sp. 2E275]|uniref:choice-of-anchor A family protein n=1 Tax=Catenovulum sp. 2E275 TaxID=2980497 RepID=UPI0021D2EBBA|nr:choice-of-anchor A family protein [Catenovulum sp. 2E275]MCU4674374.1 choice-of-anchor A family protein [Catenovulum sp. 2E275]
MKHVVQTTVVYFLSICLFSFQSNAQGTLDTYNLIIKEDLSTSSDIEGKIFVGGNINAPGLSIDVGSRLTSNPKVDAVTVVGDIEASSVKAENGHNIVYGGEIKSGTSLITNGSGGAVTKVPKSELQSDFDLLYEQVLAESAYYQSLTTNSVFDTRDSNNLKFTSGASSDDLLSVYSISASDLFNQNGSFSFNTNPSIPVVINVSGTGILDLKSKATGNFDKNNAAPLVLWNFYEASGINFIGDGWNGSVLAPFANVYASTGSIDGGLAALSFNSSVELHNKLYNYSPPTPEVTPVPEPSSLIIFAAALLLLVRLNKDKAA